MIASAQLEILASVSPSPSNFYAEWRARAGLVPALREGDDAPPERLLQAVWFHQRLRRAELRTHDGRALRVLHPGFWNREPGPDFRGAVIQFDGESPRTADIEVDLHSAGWRGHKHDVNPNFKCVGLHVVWKAERPVALPTLALQPVLDAPLPELAFSLGTDAAKSLPLELLGRCCAPLRELLPTDQLTALLHQAALVRLQAKAAQLQARAREGGWAHALWEGLFRALGYKHNVWPMQRLAELRLTLCPEKSRPAPLALQARLLGVAGLMPEELPRSTETESYLRCLWDIWWRERDAFAETALPRTLWKFSGIRPANHPQRRLALAAHWLADGKVVSRLEQWAVAKVSDAALVDSLVEIFQVARDDFWSWHWTLRSKRLAKPQPLLGATRVTDLAVNVVLPWLWIRARDGSNESLRAEMERRYLAWPCAEDNAVLKLARQRLLGGSSPRLLRGAAAQQGLLQIVRDFCEHSNALCADCRFPDLVRQWPGGTGT